MIIVSITGPTVREALAQVASSVRHADIFEFRLDLMSAPRVAPLLTSTRKPRIVTCRPVWEGGHFGGSEQARFALLVQAGTLGVEFIDIELKAYAAFLAYVEQNTSNGRIPFRAQFIVSHHLLQPGKIDAFKEYRRFRHVRSAVIKFAFQANDAWQNECASQFLEHARRDHRKAIAIAMGEAGEASRILYRVHGGWASYASAEKGSPSAPGQIPASTLKRVYRAHQLNRRTRIFGVMGYPLAHSKGMFMHNAVFKSADLNAVYCRFPVQDLQRFMAGYARHLSGLSVTIPHKESVLPFVARSSLTGRSIGSLNTLVRTPHGWHGENTDAAAALDAVERRMRITGRRVLIIGAGGTARAMLFEARQRGADVTLTNRTASRGLTLARHFGVRFVNARDVVGYTFEVVMNATAAGMWPRVGVDPLPGLSLKGVVVFDAVFNPPITSLLRRAQQEGGRAISGVEMYIRQAMAQDRLFVHISPSERLLRRALYKQLRIR